ncbi:hypothetical protein D3C80_1471160 [compost metagenome]
MAELVAQAVVVFVDQRQRLLQQGAGVIGQGLGKHRDILGTAERLGIVTTREQLAVHGTGAIGQGQALVQQIGLQPLQRLFGQDDSLVLPTLAIGGDGDMPTDHQARLRLRRQVRAQRRQGGGGQLVIGIEEDQVVACRFANAQIARRGGATVALVDDAKASGMSHQQPVKHLPGVIR